MIVVSNLLLMEVDSILFLQKDTIGSIFSSEHSAIAEYKRIFAASKPGKMPVLVFLDTGITVQLTKHDLINFRSAFQALLNMDVGFIYFCENCMKSEIFY